VYTKQVKAYLKSLFGHASKTYAFQNIAEGTRTISTKRAISLFRRASTPIFRKKTCFVPKSKFETGLKLAVVRGSHGKLFTRDTFMTHLKATWGALAVNYADLLHKGEKEEQISRQEATRLNEGVEKYSERLSNALSKFEAATEGLYDGKG